MWNMNKSNNFQFLIFLFCFFIFICQIKYSISEIIEFLTDDQKIEKCNNIAPKSEQNCNLYSTQSSYCCYLYLTDEVAALYNHTLLNSFCLSLAKKDYNKLGNINYKNMNYRINCGVATQIFSSAQYTQVVESKCETQNPVNPSQCFEKTNGDNHCCYYKINNITGCYTLGGYYPNYYRNEDNSIYYECSSNFIRTFMKNILHNNVWIHTSFFLFIITLVLF